jgi:AraC family transcriptional regulator
LDAVLRSIQLVEHQLRAPVNVRDMAAEAGYSPYYFCALFSQWAGHSPYDYIMRRRMTEAGKELIDTDRRIIDIAMDYQFETHEGFTRGYKRMFGHPPRDSMQAGCLPYLSCLEPLDRAHLECLWQAGRFVPKAVKAWEEIPGVPYDVQTCYPGNSVPFTTEQPTMLAIFELPSSTDPLIALDWILHTWLFFSPYQLHGRQVNWVEEGTLVVPLVMK